MVNTPKHRSTFSLTHKLKRAGSLALVALFVASMATPLLGGGQVSAENWPTTSPAPICGNTEALAGPSTAPSGAVTVPAGDHTGFNFNRPGTTFWFAPGTHTFGGDVYGQIIARDNATYVGAPGAIIDGKNLNLYAFTGFAKNVTVKYLTIQNFGRGNDNNNEGVVNHDAGTNWTIDHNTIINNDGAGVFMGSDNKVSYNCLKDNGQYGFSMYKDPIEGDSAIKNIVIDHNEIVGNNTDDWETQIDGCGCTGAGKFWDVNGATITNNWVHDNLSTGLWADTNNIDFLIEGNYIENNEGEGIWYEISYNATIRNNTLRHNAWVSGQANTGSPGAAIYLSESGGDARLAHSVSGAAEIRIYDNNFDNNFSGVSIYENANRFCNSNGNTSKGYCTPLVAPTLISSEQRDYDYPNPINNDHPCYKDVATESYTTDCRWHSNNVKVYSNEFHFDSTIVPCAGRYCGAQALYATGDNNMSWSPYTVAGVQNDVMFNNGNSFHDNAYYGDWVFAQGYGDTISFKNWQASPYGQDANSTFDGDTNNAGIGAGNGSGSVPTPPVVENDLDADTARLEGSTGQWHNWYSASTSQSTTQAHSGTRSLKVDVTNPWGWGVEAANWPGFVASEGAKKISLWGKLGSGSNLQPKLRVKWLDENYMTLQTNDVTLPALTSSWQQVAAVVDAPAGTSTALVYLVGSGNPGDSLYFDDIVVGNAPNVVTGTSATFEGSTGEWSNWYSAGVSASTDAAKHGTGSLKVSVTNPWGWGTQLANWPGFNAAPGAKRVSFWAKQGSGAISNATLRIKWFDASQQLTQTDLVSSDSLSTSWGQVSASVTAPAGTTSAYLDLYSSSGSAGDTLYIDDIAITDASQ